MIRYALWVRIDNLKTRVVSGFVLATPSIQLARNASFTADS